MKHLNVRDLNASIATRQARKEICFDKVLECCFHQVKKHADKNVLFCFYEVPEFMIGYPLYNLNECIAYIVAKLQKNDFLVKYYFPQILYISWNVEEIKEEKLRRNLGIIKMLEGPAAPPPGKVARKPRKQIASKTPMLTTANNAGFIKSVKQLKPSGKIVLDLNN